MAYNMVLTYFDTYMGPKILEIKEFGEIDNIKRQKKEALKNEIDDIKGIKLPVPESDITNLMDIHEPGDFFMHYFRDHITLNYCFDVEDDTARGGIHQFMLSLLFRKEDSMQNKAYFSEIFNNLDELEPFIKSIASTITKRLLIKNLAINNQQIRKDLKTELQKILVRQNI
ncbi:MAG: hypothetical protein ACTSU2_08225 [Promethearchaeota archaeon]